MEFGHSDLLLVYESIVSSPELKAPGELIV